MADFSAAASVRAFINGKLWVLHFPALCIFCAVLLLSCSTIRQIRPLAKKESAATLSLGGPITQIGKLYLPLPLVSLGYNYGLLEKLDVEAGFGLTEMLFGMLDLDLGVNWRPWLAQKYLPGLIVSPRIFGMTDFKPNSSRIYPDLGISAYWKLKKYWYVYTGVENWFEFHDTRNDGNVQRHHWLIAPYIGTHAGTQRWMFAAECKLYTPNVSNFGRPAKNIGIGENGVLGVFVGVSRYFGEKK